MAVQNFPYNPETALGNGREVMIVSCKAPGKCWHLDRGMTKNGTKIQLYDILPLNHSEYNNQIFIYDKKLDVFRPKKAPGKSVHLENENTGNGTKIHLWTLRDEGHKAQVWLFGWNNAYKQIICGIDENKSLHLEDGKTDKYTKIQLWDRRDKNHKDILNCQWDVVDVHRVKARSVWTRVVTIHNEKVEVRMTDSFELMSENARSLMDKVKIKLRDEAEVGEEGFVKFKTDDSLANVFRLSYKERSRMAQKQTASRNFSFTKEDVNKIFWAKKYKVIMGDYELSFVDYSETKIAHQDDPALKGCCE